MNNILLFQILPGDSQILIAVTIISIIIAALLFLVFNRRQKSITEPPAPVEEVAQLVENEAVTVATDEQLAEGPGQLFVRFQQVNKDLDLVTRDLQRFNGSREVQLQGWQQLTSDIIRRILPVLDNLEPYLDDADSAASDVAQLAYGRLLTELVTVGVTQIIPTPGEHFDAKYHLLSPDSTGYPPYQVRLVVSPGYRFQPRVSGAMEIVLKPAEVIVETVTAPPPAPVEETDDAIVLERYTEEMTEEV